MAKMPRPTDRELEILKILWRRGEATVRQVYEQLRKTSDLAQNTVQAFLRIMEEKGLVDHRTEGRSFVYRPLVRFDATSQTLVGNLLERLFDGAVDQFVASIFSHRAPRPEELDNLERLLDEMKKADQGRIKERP